MKQTQWELQGGLKFTLPTPENVDEYNSMAGQRELTPNNTGIAVLDDAVDNTMYRGPFADVRFALAAKLEEAYPDVPRNKKDHPKGTKNADGTTVQVYDESEGKYIARVAATKGVEISSFQPILDELMKSNDELPVDSKDKIKFDPSQRERRSGSSTEPNKGDTETAKALIAQGPKKLKISLAKITEITGQPIELVDTSDPEADVKNLRLIAFAVKAYRTNPLAGLKA